MKHLIIFICFLSLLFANLSVLSQTPVFLSDFEDQNTDPEIGGSVRTETGTSGGMYVVANPYPDSRNNSNYVLKQFTGPGTGGRAEYSTGRYETNEKKYIYTWKRFHPTEMFTDIEITGWVSLNQWKTWPCEYYGSGNYDYSDEICYGGGIFNDIRYDEPGIIDYISRAVPDCKADFGTMPKGYWNDFVLEIYWTNTEDGYYRIWRNDTLFGYSDNMKTLFDDFLEGTCNIYWSTGLYTYWSKMGNETQDSLIAYIDDITLYDIDNGFTINSVCPDCEQAPSTPRYKNEYKINLQGPYASDGYNNVITYWAGDTSAINMSNTFGQSNGVDLYLWSGSNMGTGSSGDECFPYGVINKYIYWGNDETHQICLKGLNPNSTCTFKLLGATVYSGETRGTQIWTNNDNRDTVFAANNTCNMAELTNLIADANGDLAINVKPIGGTAYINSIEIVEYYQPIDLIVSDSIITSGETACFNAHNTITVAGDETKVEIQSGASANFITEQTISILPGFHAMEGSYVLANITTNGSFCDDLSSPIVSAQFAIENSPAQALEFVRDKTYNEEQEMKVFPNPNSGEFTIQLLNFSNEVKLSVYNSLGNKVYEITTCNEKNTINLSCLNRGIYFVLAADNEVPLWQKLIIH